MPEQVFGHTKRGQAMPPDPAEELEAIGNHLDAPGLAARLASHPDVAGVAHRGEQLLVLLHARGSEAEGARARLGTVLRQKAAPEVVPLVEGDRRAVRLLQ